MTQRFRVNPRDATAICKVFMHKPIFHCARERPSAANRHVVQAGLGVEVNGPFAFGALSVSPLLFTCCQRRGYHGA